MNSVPDRNLSQNMKSFQIIHYILCESFSSSNIKIESQNLKADYLAKINQSSQSPTI